jgi:hypothetical protein
MTLPGAAARAVTVPALAACQAIKRSRTYGTPPWRHHRLRSPANGHYRFLVPSDSTVWAVAAIASASTQQCGDQAVRLVRWRLALDDVVDLEDLRLTRMFECDVGE